MSKKTYYAVPRVYAWETIRIKATGQPLSSASEKSLGFMLVYEAMDDLLEDIPDMEAKHVIVFESE